MSDDIRDDLYINKYELADLWEEHTNNFMDWGERLSDAIEERDKLKGRFDLEREDAKDELNYTKAKIEIDIRTNYTKYNLKKAPTDKYCEVLVIASDEYQDALMDYRRIVERCNKELAEAEHKINVMKIAKEAFEHRKSALDNLTRLMVGGFYQAKLPKDLKEEVGEQKTEDQAKDSISETMNRRIKKENN